MGQMTTILTYLRPKVTEKLLVMCERRNTIEEKIIFIYPVLEERQAKKVIS
jgi:hypothetical protein